VAEARRENELRALLDHVLHDAFGIGAFGNVLRLEELHPGQVFGHLGQGVME
jgi:hypothetical protein